MRLYKTKNKSIVFPAVKRNTVKVGDVFNVNNLITTGYYSDKKQMYFYEYAKPFTTDGMAPDGVVIMTDPRGKMPFAVATNDCPRDKFPEFCLSKILITEGNYIVHVYNEGKDIHVIGFRVIEQCDDVGYTSYSINVMAVIHYVIPPILSPDVDPDLGELEFMKNAINHALHVNRTRSDDYTVPKYCFNPGRIISNRLFSRNDDLELTSFITNDDIKRKSLSVAESGKQLMMNRTAVKDFISVDGDMIMNCAVRCFFGKKVIDEPVIYVDGYTLPILKKDNVDEYIYHSNINSNRVSTMLYKIITHHDEEFYAIVDELNKEIRPIYSNAYGFSSFLLNEEERKFIKDIDHVK